MAGGRKSCEMASDSKSPGPNPWSSLGSVSDPGLQDTKPFETIHTLRLERARILGLKFGLRPWYSAAPMDDSRKCPKTVSTRD
jgi:hypothetical protein